MRRIYVESLENFDKIFCLITILSMIKVTKNEGESDDKLLKRFSSHVKSRRLLQKFRAIRYVSKPLKKRKVREAAIIREKYRAEAKKKQFLVS